LQAAAATGRWPRERETIYHEKATMSRSIACKWQRKQDEIALEGLPEEHKEHWKAFNEEMAKRFPPDRIEDTKIPLHPDAPKTINCKIYSLNKEEENYVREFLKKQEGYIHPEMSPITSPIFIREKKGEKRIIVDYKEANQHSVRDSDMMVNICTILESLTGKELSSKFNTRWGYENVRISEEDQYKTAFKTTFGIYIPHTVHFRFINTPPYFQRVLQNDFAQVLQKHPNETFNYMDNFIVATEKSPEGVKWHQKIFHKILHVIEEQSYFLKLSKRQFEQMDILGWLVEDGNIKVDPAKAARTTKWPRELKNVKEVRSTWKVLGHQRPSTREFAHIAKPLTKLTKKITWTQEYREALDKLIKIVTSELVLACQNLDKPFKLETDASAYAVGTILFQEDKNERRRDEDYFPRTLNPAE